LRGKLLVRDQGDQHSLTIFLRLDNFQLWAPGSLTRKYFEHNETGCPNIGLQGELRHMENNREEEEEQIRKHEKRKQKAKQTSDPTNCSGDLYLKVPSLIEDE
jgi:hypothetical protein